MDSRKDCCCHRKRIVIIIVTMTTMMMFRDRVGTCGNTPISENGCRETGFLGTVICLGIFISIVDTDCQATHYLAERHNTTDENRQMRRCSPHTTTLSDEDGDVDDIALRLCILVGFGVSLRNTNAFSKRVLRFFDFRQTTIGFPSDEKDHYANNDGHGNDNCQNLFHFLRSMFLKFGIYGREKFILDLPLPA
jgi:hypothetical protein